jgi:hypothetical protein
MRLGPDIARRRFRIQLLIAAFAICLQGLFFSEAEEAWFRADLRLR